MLASLPDYSRWLGSLLPAYRAGPQGVKIVSLRWFAVMASPSRRFFVEDLLEAFSQTKGRARMEGIDVGPTLLGPDLILAVLDLLIGLQIVAEAEQAVTVVATAIQHRLGVLT